MKLGKKGMNLTFEQIIYITVAIIALVVVLISVIPSLQNNIVKAIGGLFS